MDQKAKDERYNIRVLERAISILSVLSDGKPRTLTQISDAITISSSTTFRLLATLASYSYVERDEQSGTYRLGLACLELAWSYHKGNDIRSVAIPELEKLRDETTETVHLAVLNRMEIVYLEKLHGLHAVGLMSSQVGGRGLAYCTGLGKVLLAYADPVLIREHYENAGFHRFTPTTIHDVDTLLQHLETIRRQGYAFDFGEHEADVRCVAAPIFDISGQVVAAISVAGPAGRMEPLEHNDELIELTVQASRRISTRLGYRETSHAPAKRS